MTSISTKQKIFNAFFPTELAVCAKNLASIDSLKSNVYNEETGVLENFSEPFKSIPGIKPFNLSSLGDYFPTTNMKWYTVFVWVASLIGIGIYCSKKILEMSLLDLPIYCGRETYKHVHLICSNSKISKIAKPLAILSGIVRFIVSLATSWIVVIVFAMIISPIKQLNDIRKECALEVPGLREVNADDVKEVKEVLPNREIDRIIGVFNDMGSGGVSSLHFTPVGQNPKVQDFDDLSTTERVIVEDEFAAQKQANKVDS